MLERSAWFQPQTGAHFRPWKGVKYIGGFQPAATGLTYSAGDQREIVRRVSVGADHNGYAAFFRHTALQVIQIEPRWLGIQLHRHSVHTGAVKQLVHVQSVWFAIANQASGRVAEYVEVRVFHGLDQARGLPFAIESHVVVD